MMIRPILLASAFALAAPVLAQSNTAIDDVSKPGVTEGIAAPDAQDRTAPNMAPGATPMSDGEDTEDSMMNTDATTGTSPTMGADANMESRATNVPTESMSSTGTAASRSGFAGVGGPAEARDYPVCSATVTDSCQQRGRRGQPL